MIGDTRSHRPRGGPIVMLALVLGGWASARAMMWHNPFAPVAPAFAQARATPSPGLTALGQGVSMPRVTGTRPTAPSFMPPPEPTQADPARSPRTSATPFLLQRASAEVPIPSPTAISAAAGDNPPFLPARPPQAFARRERWSLDGWAFWRQGSDAAPVSQGRVPIYGASQVGALLQYRIAPASARDPRLHARAYRAMVRRGEEELALGASFRPLARVPLRIAGEVRLTHAAFRNEARPSAYAITEIAPIALPHGARIEAYGQAGWVGGSDATAFADGQASITREIDAVGQRTNNAARLTVGAGAWGGAQEGAHRIDIGPSLRLDLTVAQTPLRLSIDWRERVAGEAAPLSGLAATVSARF